LAGDVATRFRGLRKVGDYAGLQHAVGDAIGNGLVEGLKPEQANGAVFNWDDVDRVVKRSGSADDNNPVQPIPLTFAQDVAMRQRANDPLGWRAAARDSESVMQRAQALWGPMPTKPDDSSLTDAATDAERTAQLMRQAGYEGELVPTGGSVRVTPASGMRQAMVNGVSVNARADAAFQAAGDLLSMGEMYRDYKLLGGLISEAQQNATLDRLKGALQGRLGMMRLLPSPEDLGAVRGIAMDSDGVGRMRYNNADLIDRYGDALRKTEMWRQGIIELDTRSMPARRRREQWSQPVRVGCVPTRACPEEQLGRAQLATRARGVQRRRARGVARVQIRTRNGH
jgi:hypothetical protein